MDALYQQGRTDEIRTDEVKNAEIAQQMEQIYINDVLALPVFQVVEKAIFSDRLVTPVDTFVSGLGWGVRYFDIVEE